MSRLGSASRGDCPWPTLAVATGCLLALAIVLFVLPAATYTAKVPNDVFSYFDAMLRMGMLSVPATDGRKLGPKTDGRSATTATASP